MQSRLRMSNDCLVKRAESRCQIRPITRFLQNEPNLTGRSGTVCVWILICRNIKRKRPEPWPACSITTVARLWDSWGLAFYVDNKRRILLLPTQIIRTGRKIIYRILGYNSWLKDFFATWERLRRLEAS